MEYEDDVPSAPITIGITPIVIGALGCNWGEEGLKGK